MSASRSRTRLVIIGLITASLALFAVPAHAHNGQQVHDQQLAPRTHFQMLADGTSGKTVGGEGIPNIDSVKSTIYRYYGDPGTGIANKAASPYIQEMNSTIKAATTALEPAYKRAIKHGEKPAIVFDADDTTLMTYDMEVAGMHFTFDPALQDVYVQGQRFPATPAMVEFVTKAADMGYTIFGLTGRNDDQKAATVANLGNVGYTDFAADRFYTKWTGKGSSQQPSYITCAVAKCTTVEYKAQTRKHIEEQGYSITLNVGDQWSDLQGGYADQTLKLPNPTYYLPSANLPGVKEPRLTPRTQFNMAANGTSGLKGDGEGIPNIDSVKRTIYRYYGDPGTGIANKIDSPYIQELAKLTKTITPQLTATCRQGARRGTKPAVVLDADDTTLWTYDMEVAGMHFTFDPALQNVYVQDQRFAATPRMVTLAAAAQNAGCTIIGLTGRNDGQKAATLGNLATIGYTGFTAANYYTKWTGKGTSVQPSYITCAMAKCTTIEYKSQTRKHVESAGGGHYDIVANLGDQFSDLVGGSADRAIKLPNPTYYLP